MSSAPITLVEAVDKFIGELRGRGYGDWFIKEKRSILDQFVRWCEANEKGFVGEWKFHVGTVQPYNYADGDYVAVCPECGSTDRQIKVGFHASGSQRYKCQHCKRKYTPRSEV